MNRREFLAAAAAAAVGLRACPAAGRAKGRVVVVGAGLAGLACAYELRRAGWQVTVLEARDWAGGRVLTIRKPFRGQHAEAGGEFLDANHRTALAYVRRFDLMLEDQSKEPDLDGVLYLRGRRRSLEAAEAAVAAEIDRFRRRLDAVSARVDPADPVGTAAALDRRTAGSLIRELRLSPTARWLVEHDLRDEFTVEPSRLSLLFLAVDNRLGGDVPEAGAERYRIRGGNDRLPLAFAEALGDDLQLDTRVRRIDRQPRIRVETTGGSVDADYCVLTAPVRTWVEIEFVPELPEPLALAPEELQYGIGTKVHLQYERRFWRQRGQSGDVLTDLKMQTTWEATNLQPGKRGILTAFTAGKNGLLYSTVNDGGRILLAADEIDDVYPGSRALIVNSATQAWANDRWSRGTYLAYAPGQVVKYWRALRRPLGRLYFAGEHADVYTGSMEGALRSGRRVAAEIDRRGA